MNTHRRFYIYRVVRPTGVTEYRESTGCWYPAPELAMTWATFSFAEKKAKELKRLEKRSQSDYFVGEVELTPTTTAPVKV
jgi:hypothetical protein